MIDFETIEVIYPSSVKDLIEKIGDKNCIAIINPHIKEGIDNPLIEYDKLRVVHFENMRISDMENIINYKTGVFLLAEDKKLPYQHTPFYKLGSLFSKKGD